ncbi:hypothetical protein ABW99_13145 [Pandoraea thiooxydans]|uniref:PglD N-terminal domain-containing protein n=1 Tax=Pandoraea thiooxydans TaxID=445709 RepID=A0A0G3EWB0_9BURK|nr:acetyltransferase [Pandoraea thiooxydans]AKJ69011.1 hypothetical protein ABW99_13145 [Pandoraea thiooxydans]
MDRLIILGAGGHGSVVADVATVAVPDIEILFLDDRYPQSRKSWHWPIVGALVDFKQFIDSSTHFLVAIGANSLRHQWQTRIREESGHMATLIHPSAVVSRYSTIGPGTVVFPAAVINIGAVLGEGCIINTGAIVEHDCRLGAAVHICPNVGVAGSVTIGDRATIGVGSAVRPGVHIGSDVIIGAGASVVHDIPSGITAFGVPAKNQSE